MEAHFIFKAIFKAFHEQKKSEHYFDTYKG